MESKKILGILVLVFFLTRALFLFNAPLGTEVYSSEETGKRGAIAYKWLKGEPGVFFKFFRKTGTHHQLGLVVEGAVTSVFFKVFGISFHSLMFVVVLEGLGIMVLLYLLSERFFGRAPAVLSSLLFIFSFPTWLFSTVSQASTVLLGVLASLLVVYLYLRFLEDSNSSNLFFLGFFMGFGMFLDLLQVCLVNAVVVFHFVFFEFSGGVRFSDLFKGFFAGFLPYLSYLVDGLMSKGAQKSSEHLITFHDKPLYSIFQLNGFNVFLTLFNYVKGSFGFQRTGFGIFNWVFMVALVSIIGLSIYFSVSREEEGVSYVQVLLLLLFANLSVLLFTSISERMHVLRYSLQRTYEYVSIAHMCFIGLVSAVIGFSNGWKKRFAGVFTVLLVLLNIFVVPTVLTVGGQLYDPIRGMYFTIFDQEDRPESYEAPSGLFQEFGYFHPGGYDETGLTVPPFTRNFSEMRNACSNFSDPGFCFEVFGMHIYEIRRYDVDRVSELCGRTNGFEQSCLKGVSFARGYHGFNKNSEKICDVKYEKTCLKGQDAGKTIYLNYGSYTGHDHIDNENIARVREVIRYLNSVL